MSDAPVKLLPPRAIASILFACSSLLIVRAYGQLVFLPARFSKDGSDMFRRVLTQVGPIRDELDIAYRLLAAISLAYCIWSWRTEARLPAAIATPFAAFAVFCAVFVVI